MTAVPTNAAIVGRAAGLAVHVVPRVRQTHRLPGRIVEIRRCRIGDILAHEFPLFVEVDVHARRGYRAAYQSYELHDDEEDKLSRFLFVHGRSSVRGTRTVRRAIFPPRVKSKTLSATPNA